MECVDLLALAGDEREVEVRRHWPVGPHCEVREHHPTDRFVHDRDVQLREHRAVEAHALRPVGASDLHVIEHVSEEIERYEPTVH
jgi:hypothetical protein